jgi:hypothetical protein
MGGGPCGRVGSRQGKLNVKRAPPSTSRSRLSTRRSVSLRSLSFVRLGFLIVYRLCFVGDWEWTCIFFRLFVAWVLGCNAPSIARGVHVLVTLMRGVGRGRAWKSDVRPPKPALIIVCLRRLMHTEGKPARHTLRPSKREARRVRSSRDEMRWPAGWTPGVPRCTDGHLRARARAVVFVANRRVSGRCAERPRQSPSGTRRAAPR